MNKLEQFADDISAMHENAEHVLNQAGIAQDANKKSVLGSYSLLLKGQAVLAEIMLEVLKTQNRKP